ncbi:MAG TPA: hypothetical protein PK816_17050, partial [Candidatus Cloacimonadota bacterium]|nr:hypothetical protein [Candidatus Cloacimonadota bacterium]
IVPYRYTYDQLNANPLQSDPKLYKNNAVPTFERFITKLLYKMGLNEVLKVEGQIPTLIYGRDYNWNIPELQNQRAVLFAGRYLADDTPENKKNTIQAAIRAFVNNDMPISAGGEWKVEDSWVNIDNAVESFKGGLGQAGFDSYKRLMKFISEHFTDDELKDWIKWGVKERNDLAMGRKKMSDVYTDMWVKDVSNGVPIPDNRRFPDPETFPEIKEKRKLGDERPIATIQTNVGPNKYQLNLIPNIWNRPINNYFQ